jgi:hypothetical protein
MGSEEDMPRISTLTYFTCWWLEENEKEEGNEGVPGQNEDGPKKEGSLLGLAL